MLRITHDETQQERRARQRAEQEARNEEAFSKTRNAETSYRRNLRHLARQVARIVEAFAPKAEDEPIPPQDLARIETALGTYAKAITPWARATAARMITEVNRRDRTAWQKYTQGMSQALRREIQSAPTGERMMELLEAQVDLITSLPWDAAREIQERTLSALEFGGRFPEQEAEIAEKLRATHPNAMEEWVTNRATLIARTETARAASVLTQARAEHVGSEQYIWRTAGDWKVRESHRALENSVQRWDAPPLSDPPDHHSHPGQIWNCRCIALPILPE